eukprot:4944437-Prymnesium_polylepis.1
MPSQTRLEAPAYILSTSTPFFDTSHLDKAEIFDVYLPSPPDKPLNGEATDILVTQRHNDTTILRDTLYPMYRVVFLLRCGCTLNHLELTQETSAPPLVRLQEDEAMIMEQCVSCLDL